MRLIRRLETAHPRDCVLTIGSFDGLHLGHRALIERALQHAAQRQVPAMMVSFEPLPREYLQASDPPARLTNFRERWRLLEHSGLDRLCLLHFAEPLRSQTAEQFMQHLQAARARVIVIGHDFRFGRHGAANAQWCVENAARFGLEFDVIDSIQSGGRVRHGNQLGRKLGFPTANIPVKRRRVPLAGVYAVWVRGAGTLREPWPAVASLGTRPMAGGGLPLLEACLFDFDGDLYDRELEVEFVALLRGESTFAFASMEAMVTQMHRDAADARRILGI
jgi:riboflavin kinase/FMN adenylyltransferase